MSLPDTSKRAFKAWLDTQGDKRPHLLPSYTEWVNEKMLTWIDDLRKVDTDEAADTQGD